MLRLKGQVSKIDTSIFYCFDKEGLYGILAVHVNDFLWVGSKVYLKLEKKQPVNSNILD